MGELWSRFWRSRVRAIAAGIALSAATASVLYVFTWQAFYATRTHEAERRAVEIASDLSVLHHTLGDGASAKRLAEAVRAYVANRPAQITATLERAGGTLWAVRNDAPVDESRSVVSSVFELEGEAGVLHVGVREAVRPRLFTALFRAWTLSLADYLADPQRWRDDHLYHRSLPLFGTLLVVGALGLGTARAFHRDQHALARVADEAREAAQELDRLHAEHGEEIQAMRAQVSRTEAQRDAARRQRERLVAEIADVDREVEALGARGDEPLGVTQSLESLRAIAERKARAESELSQQDERIAGYEGEIRAVRSELGAAEELLVEVEEKREDLQARLRSRSREMQKLEALVQQAQRMSHTLHFDRLRPSRTQLERGEQLQLRLEAQLARWLRAPGKARVNFSEHSRAVEVEAEFRKLDRALVDRYFSHVTNPAYERGARRTIRVRSAPDDGSVGELVVVLDDDAGRTLGLRYALRKGAPDAVHVGFVLAMLLRASSRELRGYEIRAR